MPGISVKDVDQQKYVIELANFLKKSGKMKVPEFVDYVKLGRRKELSPLNPDWYYVRAASVARHLYIRAPAGVKTFAKIYGGSKNNGVMPSHFSPCSTSVARKILQSLEQMDIVEIDSNTGGRKLTSHGRRDLDRIANQMQKSSTKIEVVEE